ncbi:uncharacterized protein LOC124446396 isoform X3 [Xenia sp. Carnegie-2017]|uniref:uncharacterized protein LOC124446396 isoform X3 n=1 Tax=Xenia sp. Carnegie-2017 TaxID=2897299 RepID=UPI001F03A0BB|nr:uncharacterized protein LOC124446396 isoform X3 [Xenia sp. Carnegie-2017]
MSMLIRTFQSNVSLNGSTVNNTTEQDKIYNRITLVPLFMTLYGIIFLVAFGGNLLVIYVVSTNRKMHEVTVNYLLVNLAIADLIQTLSSIFHVADFLLKDLNIGEVGCKFQINMNNIPYGASVLTLGVIAYDRYCAVCKSVSFGDGRLYLLVIRKLRQPIPGEDAGTTITYQSRQGVVKMLLVTIASFFVSWTPYNILYFLKRIKYDFRSVYSSVRNPREGDSADANAIYTAVNTKRQRSAVRDYFQKFADSAKTTGTSKCSICYENMAATLQFIQAFEDETSRAIQRS